MGGNREGKCRLASDEYVGQGSREVEPRLEGPRKPVSFENTGPVLAWMAVQGRQQRWKSLRRCVQDRGVCQLVDSRSTPALRALAFFKVGGQSWPRSLGTVAVEE